MNESPYKFETTTAGFMADVVEASASRPVLVDFWAEWCGPCRTLMPMLDRIADDYAGRFALVKVNTDQEPEIAGHFGIRSIPTVILFHGGQPVEQFVGVQPEGTIRALLDKYVGQETDEPAGGREDPVRQVETLIGNRDAAAVRVALDRLAAEAPEHAALPSLRARAAFLDAALEHPDAVALRWNRIPTTRRRVTRSRRITRSRATTRLPWANGSN
jgi:putative thioredoxin